MTHVSAPHSPRASLSPTSQPSAAPSTAIAPSNAAERAESKRALGIVLRALDIPRGRLLAAIGAAVATLASSFALAAVSAWLVTRAWTMPPVLSLSVAVTAVRGLGVSRGVFRWLDRMFTHSVALRGVVSLRTRLFASLASQRSDSLTRLRRGDLLARLGDDAQEIGNHVINAVVPAWVSAAMLVIITLTLIPISGWAALAMFLSLVVANILAPWAALRSSMAAEEAVVTSRTHVTARAIDIVDDATALRLQGDLGEELRQLAQEHRTFDAAMDKAAFPAALAAGVVPLVMIPALVASVLVAGHAWTQGVHGAGVIGILLLLPLSAYEAAQALPAAASQLGRSRAAALRVVRAASNLDQRASHDGPSEAPQRGNIMAEAGIADSLKDYAQGGITDAPESEFTSDVISAGSGADALTSQEKPTDLTLTDLSAGWSADAPRVRNLSLHIPAGSRIAVVGPSGIGKSTLLATIAGLLDPVSGTVRIDNADISTMPVEQVRSQVVFFPEDAHVFSTSVRENVRVAQGRASDEEITAALEVVGLKEWIETLPAGLDTILGPDGTTISGGERRRLLLARAVIRSAPISLLDEPTEHLDAERGDALLSALLTPGDSSLLPAHGSALVVTHRREAIPAGTPVLEIHDTGATTYTEAPRCR